MFIPIMGRRNALAYLLWRWIFRANGSRCASFDQYFFGSSHGMNDYDELASNYRRSDVKPDKAYSILPTVLEMIGDCRGKACTDIGCGGGFFSIALAIRGAERVYGLDNSREQLTLACRFAEHPAITYVLRDVLTEKLKPTDIVVVAFVTNYAQSKPILYHFFRQIYDGLNEGGKAVLVVDLPNGKELKRFGAVKRIQGAVRDEAPIEITLFNENTQICNLHAVYYSPSTIESALRKVGFREICWYKPLVSEEGINIMGAKFWEGYADDPELGYILAKK